MLIKQTMTKDRLRYVALFFLAIAAWLVVRLFTLQVIQHDYYALFALNTHQTVQKLYPNRGQIYFQDTRSGQTFPAAVNRDYYLVYAAPREIPPDQAATTSAQIAALLSITDPGAEQTLLQKLSDSKSSYAVLGKKISEGVAARLKARPLPGVYSTPQTYRYYPELNIGSNLLGFTSLDDSGLLQGKYGVEGYWDQELAGKGGLRNGEKGALGGWIALAGRKIIPPQDGPDLVLTIDRTLEYEACTRLRQGLKDYGAKSASLVMMNPNTGAVLAMCSLPDFDPNNYSQMADLAAFNNTSVFTPYEPGSVFKAVTMAAGLDLGLITPETTYTDPGEWVIDGFHVRNALRAKYGLQTMTNVLEKSINTGAVWVEKQIGGDRFKQYVDKFGFGEKSGIEIDTESAGNTDPLNKSGEIFGADGSFGQGFTVTPLQLAAAYSAIANGGRLPKPVVISEIRYTDGHVDRPAPQLGDQIISSRAADLLSGMLVSVVENHYHAAKIDHYYIAGKTGTAQIPEKGGYSATRTNHTFAGFGPADHPAITLIVKYEEPKQLWAEQTALPVFKDIMKFALDYYGIKGTR